MSWWFGRNKKKSSSNSNLVESSKRDKIALASLAVSTASLLANLRKSNELEELNKKQIDMADRQLSTMKGLKKFIKEKEKETSRSKDKENSEKEVNYSCSELTSSEDLLTSIANEFSAEFPDSKLSVDLRYSGDGIIFEISYNNEVLTKIKIFKEGKNSGKWLDQSISKNSIPSDESLCDYLSLVLDNFENKYNLKNYNMSDYNSQRWLFSRLTGKNCSKQKQYSVESGGYSGGKRTPGQNSYLMGIGTGVVGGAVTGAMVGGPVTIPAWTVIGGGLGAFSTWMSNIADKSLFNTGLSNNANSFDLIQAIEDEYSPEQPDEREVMVTRMTDSGSVVSTRQKFNKRSVAPGGVVYDVDKDPRKYVISALYRGNVLVLYINDPSSSELRRINGVLDDYCRSYRDADYSSSIVSKNVYVVELFVVDRAESDVAISLIKSGFKLNIITGSKFGIGKR